MARAKKFRGPLFPVVSAPQVRALRPECHNLLVRELDDPRSLFLAGNFPAVDPVPAEYQLNRSLGLQCGYIACFDPAGFGPRFGRKKKIQQCGRCQSRGDGSPKSVNESKIKAAARGWRGTLPFWDRLHSSSLRKDGPSDLQILRLRPSKRQHRVQPTECKGVRHGVLKIRLARDVGYHVQITLRVGLIEVCGGGKEAVAQR